MHGYGASGACFYPLFKELGTAHRLICVDIFGMGTSTRAPVDKEQLCNTKNAENFFVEPLEKWRKIMNIDKFSFVAHSFGGYVGTCYSLKY